MNALEKRPGPFLKFFLKMPVWMHKLGLGGWERLIGARWMLVTTTGRKSGKLRETMLDVMDYNSATDTYYIDAAYGSRADWVRNIEAHPRFQAQVGRRKFFAHLVPLSSGEAGEMMVNFYHAKPAYTRSVMAMVGMKFEGVEELREIASKLTLFAVHPEK
jgi:deazaflavin-dependent oxidoreductase (nitroreductase family)